MSSAKKQLFTDPVSGRSRQQRPLRCVCLVGALPLGKRKNGPGNLKRRGQSHKSRKAPVVYVVENFQVRRLKTSATTEMTNRMIATQNNS